MSKVHMGCCSRFRGKFPFDMIGGLMGYSATDHWDADVLITKHF